MRKCINQLNESIYQIFRRSFLWWGHLSEVEDVKTVHICNKLNSQHKQLNAQKTLFDGANGNLNLVQAKTHAKFAQTMVWLFSTKST